MKDLERVTIRKVVVEEWKGIDQAAKILKRTSTQIRRHVSGVQPSAKLARDMEKHGIVVQREVAV